MHAKLTIHKHKFGLSFFIYNSLLQNNNVMHRKIENESDDTVPQTRKRIFSFSLLSLLQTSDWNCFVSPSHLHC